MRKIHRTFHLRYGFPGLTSFSNHLADTPVWFKQIYQRYFVRFTLASQQHHWTVGNGKADIATMSQPWHRAAIAVPSVVAVTVMVMEVMVASCVMMMFSMMMRIRVDVDILILKMTIPYSTFGPT